MNRMKMLSCLLAGALALPLAASVSVSHGRNGAMSVTARDTEVLVAPDAPSATRFAAQELVKFLSQVLGASVPLTTSPSRSKIAIVVGENEWSHAAGVDVSALKRDGFIIRCVPEKRRIYVVGRDDAKFDLARAVETERPDGWRLPCECASVFAAYDFLERYAGVRFYFPGEMGTVVPRRAAVKVPAGEVRSEPDWRCRVMFTGEFGKWPDNLPIKEVWRRSRLEQLRLRSQTERFTCSHGQYHMNMAKRFGKTHPEYFTMKPDGSRWNDPSGKAPGRSEGTQDLCQSSKVWDEIFEDAKSYFSGEGPERRGVLSGFDDAAKVQWGTYAIDRRYYDVMPHDGHPRCHCPDCQAGYAKAPDPRSAASDIVWGQTARLARRIKEAGLDGTILQAAYADYKAIPSVDIPENVIVNVCRRGPWRISDGEAAYERELEEVRAWGRKVGGRIWVWVYMGKFPSSNLWIPDIPIGTPRATARYMKAVAPYVMGVFPEPASDFFIHHYLDFYIYARMAWDNDCDADAVLAEHYRLMFGAGGKAMERLFDELEDIWLKKVFVSNKHPMSPWGYKMDAPDEYQAFTKVYSPKVVAGLEKMVAEALAAVPAGSMEAKRIKYVCDRLVGPLAKRTKEYPMQISPENELKWRSEHPGESVLKNGSFDSLKDWGCKNCAIDTNVFFSAPSSIRLTSNDTTPAGQKNTVYDRASALQRVELKPSTRYRLSGLVKMDGVTAVCSIGGLGICVSAVARTYPSGQKFPSGTRDWHRFAYEFKTPDKVGGSVVSYIGPRLALAYGTAWIDDIRLDELP